MKARVADAGRSIGGMAKKGARSAGYAIQDGLERTGKWLTRPSMSKAIATGAGIGALVGRYAGGRVGQTNHEAKQASIRKAKETRAHKQALEIARVRAITEQVLRANR